MTKNIIAGEEDAFILLNEKGSSPYVLVCEHASNRVPKQLGNLGLSAGDLQRHIAWDIGAEGVSRLLSRLLDAPLFCSAIRAWFTIATAPPIRTGRCRK